MQYYIRFLYSIIILCLFLQAGCHKAKTVSVELPQVIITGSGIKSANRQWVQTEFVLSTFGGVPFNDKNDPNEVLHYKAAIKNLKEANFNFIETVWQSQAHSIAILNECDQQQGITVMVQDIAVLGGIPGFGGNINSYHPDSVAKFIRIYGTYKSIGGIYLHDEPAPNAFHTIRKNMDDLEVRRPDLLGFAVLFPSYVAAFSWESPYMTYDRYVDQYITDVDPTVLSSDYYPFSHHTGVTLPEEFYLCGFWKDLSFLRKRALEHDLIHWFYYQAQKITPDWPTVIKPEHITVQAWAAIMYGVKGLSSFTAFTSVINDKGEKDYLFDATKKLNSQIKALGNTLLSLRSQAIYHGSDLTGDPFADEIDSSRHFVSIPKHVSVGEFTDKNENSYLLILNRDYISSHLFDIPLKRKFRIYLCNKDNEGKQSILYEQTDRLVLNIQAADAVLIRIENPSTPPTSIVYKISGSSS